MRISNYRTPTRLVSIQAGCIIFITILRGNAIKLTQVIDMPDEAVAHRSPRNSGDMIFRDAVRRLKMPLFKYLHPDRTEVLKNRCIRFSSPCVLNDPFELKPHLAEFATTNYMEDELRRILPKIIEEELAKIPNELRKKIPPKKLLSLLTGQIPETRMGLQSMATVLLPKLQQAMENKLAQLVGILCLSEHPDNLLMWSHYADSHRGYVIAFDERSEFFDRRLNSQDELRHLRRVTYSSKRPSLTLASVDDFSAFMTKGRVWEYEDEWRMIVPLSDATKVIGSGPIAVHLYEFPAKAVQSIIFGCLMSDVKIQEIREIVAKSAHYNHVPCVQAKISKEHYLVQIPKPDA